MKWYFTPKFNALVCFCTGLLFISCSNTPEDEDGPHSPTVPENAINLSAEGTANCYIAPPRKTVALDVRYKGNSKSERIGEVADVKLCWQDQPGLVTKVYLTREQMLVAELGTASGNALVGAVDAKGNLLWSWHLWVAEYTPSKDLFTTKANAAGTTWTFMDRNLGALNKTPSSFDSHGMIYQWGRKDPFTSAGTFTVINEDYSYQVDGERPLYDIDNKVLLKTRLEKEYHGTIEKSLRNPQVFFAMTYEYTGEKDEYGEEIVLNDYRTKDWVDVSDDDYWGGVSGRKTIYDPCPVGYKIPTCDTGGNTPYAWLVYANMTWDAVNHGATQDGQWFPATGTRVYASGGLDHQDANPYSGLWIGTAGKANANLEEFPDLYGQYMFIINGKRTFKVSKDARSQGMSVRCVKE